MAALRNAGKDAALLWYMALNECAAVDEGAGGDGLMTPLLVKDTAHLQDLNAKRTAAKLVDVGLWHDVTTVRECGECMQHGGDRVGPDDHFIHEWWDRLLLAEGKRDPIVRKREQRRKALNNDKELVARIRSRDQDRCAYCGDLTLDSSGPNKKGAKVRQLDHVDPWSENSFDGVRVSCRTCNGRKRDRTPEEAGMTLWAPGTTREQIKARTAVAIRAMAGSDPAVSGRHLADRPDHPAEDPASRERARETGRAGWAPGPRPDDPAEAVSGTGPGSGSSGSGR